MACLGNLVIGLLGRAGPVNLAAELRRHARDPRRPSPPSGSASDLSCSGLVTTPAEVVEEGSGLGGDAGLGGYLLGADGDSG